MPVLTYFIQKLKFIKLTVKKSSIHSEKSHVNGSNIFFKKSLNLEMLLFHQPSDRVTYKSFSNI